MTFQLLDNGYDGPHFMADLLWLLMIIISIVGAVLSLYAVYIAYLFFTASDANKRKAAKDRLLKLIASFLIVFTAIPILKVIDVQFNTPEGNFSGGSSGAAYTGYVYDGEQTMNLTAQTGTGGMVYAQGTIKIDPKDIYGDKNGRNATLVDVKLTQCQILKPTDMAVYKRDANVGAGEAFTFKFDFKNQQSLGTTTLPTENITVGQRKTKGFILEISFEFKEATNGSVRTGTVQLAVEAFDTVDNGTIKFK